MYTFCDTLTSPVRGCGVRTYPLTILLAGPAFGSPDCFQRQQLGSGGQTHLSPNTIPVTCNDLVVCGGLRERDISSVSAIFVQMVLSPPSSSCRAVWYQFMHMDLFSLVTHEDSVVALSFFLRIVTCALHQDTSIRMVLHSDQLA